MSNPRTTHRHAALAVKLVKQAKANVDSVYGAGLRMMAHDTRSALVCGAAMGMVSDVEDTGKVDYPALLDLVVMYADRTTA